MNAVMPATAGSPNSAVALYPRASYPLAGDASGPLPLVRWMFYLFVFSVPLLHTIDVGEDARLPKLIGYLFLFATLLQPRVCFRQFPGALWCFVAYTGVYALLGAFQQSILQQEIYERLFTLIQLLVMSWVAFNLFCYDRVAKEALLALIASCVLLAILQVSGLGATGYGAGRYTASTRVSALGQNANELACTLSLALIALLGLVYSSGRRALPLRHLAWPCLILLGLAVVLTGSRGGVVALAGGLMVFMLLEGTLQARVRNWSIGFLVLGFVVLISAQYETARERWSATLGGGTLAHREHLFPAAWEMFLESPIVGWGPVQNIHELGWRVRYVGWANPDQSWRDTHNLFLWVLIQAGLLGAIPFFAGVGLWIRAAWKARQGPQGILPLAMTATFLIADLSGNWVHSKLHWLVMAYALASASPLVLRRLQISGWQPTSPRARQSLAPSS